MDRQGRCPVRESAVFSQPQIVDSGKCPPSLRVAKLAGCFLGMDQVGLNGGPVSVVAHSTFLEQAGRVGVHFLEGLCFVAIKAAPLEAETPARREFVALGACNVGDGRVLLEGGEFSRSVGSREEADFLTAAYPFQDQRVGAGGNLHLTVEHIGEWLCEFERLAVEFQAARWSGGDETNRSTLVR